MIKKILLSSVMLTLLAACSGESNTSQLDTHRDDNVKETSSIGSLAATRTDSTIVEKYITTYKNKDIEGFESIFVDNVISALYPDRLFTNERTKFMEAAGNDFKNRPDAYLTINQQYQVADDVWVTFGSSVNGEENAPMMLVFDLDDVGSKIEAIYTKIGATSFISGPSVTNPTPAMLENLKKAISGDDDLQSALAPNVGIYAYPPATLDSQKPFASGKVQAAQFLSQWGKETLASSQSGDETFISRYMQFVFVGAPGPKNGNDRVALFTLGADPDGDGFEKVTRVDILGFKE